MNKHTVPQGIYDMVTLGERGQVVIPQAIREQIGLKAGDKLMVILKDGHGPMIGLVPPAAFREWVSTMADHLSRFDETQADASESKKEEN